MPNSPSSKCNAECLWEKDNFMYGSITLEGYQLIGGKSPKFVRANKDFPNLSKNLYKLMTEVWNFSKPELIISLNGGAKYMERLNSDQQLAFKRGLIDVAKSAPTWIVTGGFEAGVSKLVGEASKDFSILSQKQTFTVLGIGSWGATYNNQSLIMTSEDKNPTYRHAGLKQMESGQCQLNPHHDAFILYDDCTNINFGSEIEFRALFEKTASDKAKCSVVQLIVEGGENTVYTGVKALESKIPVVVMKGSGRVADVICDVVEAIDIMLEETLILKCSELRKLKIKLKTHESDFKANLKKFFDCNKDQEIVHLFNMSDFKNHLDTAIIKAAFSGTIRGKKLTDLEKLKLAMTFNRVDVAEEKIVIEKINSDLIKYMILALKGDKWQFVDLFLRHGRTMDSIITRKVLLELYFGHRFYQFLNGVLW